MKKWIILLLVLGLSGCVTTRDQVGNVYPEQCRGEMVCNATTCTMAGKTIPYVVLSPSQMIVDKTGKPFWGTYNYISGMAFINSSVATQKDTLRHEVCHAVAGRWHPE